MRHPVDSCKLVKSHHLFEMLGSYINNETNANRIHKASTKANAKIFEINKSSNSYVQIQIKNKSSNFKCIK